jgi:hypothetical protein
MILGHWIISDLKQYICAVEWNKRSLGKPRWSNVLFLTEVEPFPWLIRSYIRYSKSVY